MRRKDQFTTTTKKSSLQRWMSRSLVLGLASINAHMQAEAARCLQGDKSGAGRKPNVDCAAEFLSEGAGEKLKE